MKILIDSKHVGRWLRLFENTISAYPTFTVRSHRIKWGWEGLYFGKWEVTTAKPYPPLNTETNKLYVPFSKQK